MKKIKDIIQKNNLFCYEYFILWLHEFNIFNKLQNNKPDSKELKEIWFICQIYNFNISSNDYDSLFKFEQLWNSSQRHIIMTLSRIDKDFIPNSNYINESEERHFLDCYSKITSWMKCKSGIGTSLFSISDAEELEELRSKIIQIGNTYCHSVFTIKEVKNLEKVMGEKLVFEDDIKENLSIPISSLLLNNKKLQDFILHKDLAFEAEFIN